MDAIELTKQLISMKTETVEAANAAVDFIYDMVCQKQIPQVECRILENEGRKMLYAKTAWVSGTNVLVFNGHLDVVPAAVRQYIPVERGGRLYGRGSYDMLGGCAVMIQAFLELADLQLSCGLCLMLSTSEETNGKLCTAYMLEHIEPFNGFAICGEPTNLNVSIMSKGIFRFKAVVHGRSAHSSRPWLGDNAIVKAVDYYIKISELPFTKRKNAYFSSASVNLSILSGGTVINQVPEAAAMQVDIRYVPGTPIDEMQQAIRACCPDMEIISEQIEPAVEVAEDDPYFLKLVEQIQQVTQRTDCVVAQHGAADTLFFQARGIPSVEFGLCGQGHHGAEEYVEIESFEKYHAILKRFALSVG